MSFNVSLQSKFAGYICAEFQKNGVFNACDGGGFPIDWSTFLAPKYGKRGLVVGFFSHPSSKTGAEFTHPI